MLKSNKPRLVIRKTNRYILAQIVESEIAQDKTIIKVSSKDLLQKGWPEENKGSLKSLPASYLTGFLIGSLAKGKIKPSPEAIYSALKRAPYHMSRARYGLYLALDSLYWALVDSSHAALMMTDKVAPSPEHIPEMLDIYFVKKRMLNKKHVDLYREIYGIMHESSKNMINVPSKKIDEYQKRADSFINEMARIVRKLE